MELVEYKGPSLYIYISTFLQLQGHQQIHFHGALPHALLDSG